MFTNLFKIILIFINNIANKKFGQKCYSVIIFRFRNIQALQGDDQK